MFLLGWPARTRSRICRWRVVKVATRSKAVSRDADNFRASSCLIERAFDAGEKLPVADRLLDEIHGSSLHRLNCHGHGAIAGDDDGGQFVAFTLETFDQLDTAHSGHHRIDQNASFPSGTKGFEEGRPVSEHLHRISVLLEQIAHDLAEGAVIVDNKNSLPTRRFGVER